MDAAANGDLIQLDSVAVGDFSVVGKALTFRGVGWVGQLTASGGADLVVDGMTLAGGDLSTDPADLDVGRWCLGTTPTAISATEAALTVVGSTFQCFDAGAGLATDSDLTVEGSTSVANGPGGDRGSARVPNPGG